MTEFDIVAVATSGASLQDESCSYKSMTYTWLLQLQRIVLSVVLSLSPRASLSPQAVGAANAQTHTIRLWAG